ncbi:MAG: hypothetical protein L6R38_001670 [Xanthoria sp. 2 TBL-2021]|nr:MAG: hypothetical protein L6R38_001670 [Xanthoria sp. 2 TBL-2021]
MLKGAAPIAVLLVLSSIGLEPLALSQILNISFIVFGISLTSYGEMELDIWGCLLQIGAVFFEASRLAFTQKLLKDHNILLTWFLLKPGTQIGKTSSLALTLCGVLKSICLIKSGAKHTIAMSLIMGCMGFFAVFTIWFSIDLDLNGHLP